MINTRVYKEKQYLVFDYENGKTVKYDFATKQSIGMKGKPVKGLQSQLSGMTTSELFDNCDDKKYAKFLEFVKNKHSCYPISNIGTILDRVPNYSNYEQLFSAGIDDIVDKGNTFKYTINELPKALIKLCKDRNIQLSNNYVQYYKENPDAHLLAYHLEFLSLNDKDIQNIWSTDNSDYNRDTGKYIYWSYFNTLLNEYGYNAKSLLLYIDQLKTFEAIEGISYIMRELYDYARMMKTISERFDKYPRHFLTTHKIACRNYNRLKKEFEEELFKKRIDKKLESAFGKYQFIYPETTQDIKNEAVEQNNCVASYIDNVIDGKCHILFLRRKESPDKSLVTVEVRENHIVQARRRFNDPVTEEEQEVIDMWNKKYLKKEKEKAA